jgi:hypothetical protein
VVSRGASWGTGPGQFSGAAALGASRRARASSRRGRSGPSVRPHIRERYVGIGVTRRGPGDAELELRAGDGKQSVLGGSPSPLSSSVPVSSIAIPPVSWSALVTMSVSGRSATRVPTATALSRCFTPSMVRAACWSAPSHRPPPASPRGRTRPAPARAARTEHSARASSDPATRRPDSYATAAPPAGVPGLLFSARRASCQAVMRSSADVATGRSDRSRPHCTASPRRCWPIGADGLTGG